MTVYVLGSTGMLGHQVLRYFQQRGQYPTVGTTRAHQDWEPQEGDTVINCIGFNDAANVSAFTVPVEFEPKPAPQTYRKFLGNHAVDPTRAAMFEDLARNLTVPHELGMTTVLVVPDGTKEVVREDWELEGRDAAHVDHVTDDLAGFLAGLSP